MSDHSKKEVPEAIPEATDDALKHRSHVKPKMHGLAEKYPDMGYTIGKSVYVNGPRGLLGPWEIAEVLGDGNYKLKEGEEVKQRIFREDELSEKPRWIE